MEITVKKLEKIGLPFPNWRVVKEIGSGTYGSVFRIESRSGDVSALKVIPVPTSEADLGDAMVTCGGDVRQVRAQFEPMLQRILEREIGTAEKCASCPNVMRIFEKQVVDDPQEPAQRYIMVRMELLMDMRVYLERSTDLRSDVLRMMQDMGHALAYLEQKHIIHRDIKTANIMVDGNGTFKLADFGEAREVQQNGNHTIARGTPYYMAPEVYRGRPYDNRADIYSLGIVAYYFLNGGKYPLVGAMRPREAWDQRMRGVQCPDIRGLDIQFNRVLQRCIAFDPRNRYNSAQALLSDLGRLPRQGSIQAQKGSEHIPQPATPVSRQEASSEPPVPTRGLSGGALAGIIVGAVVGTILILVLIALGISNAGTMPRYIG